MKIESIKLRIDDNLTVELTPEKAKALRDQLNDLLGYNRPIQFIPPLAPSPVFVPIISPWYGGLEPWRSWEITCGSDGSRTVGLISIN